MTNPKSDLQDIKVKTHTIISSGIHDNHILHGWTI